MKKRKGEVHIGHYFVSLKPLGVVMIVILVLALIAGGLFLFKDELMDLVSKENNVALTTPVPTVEPTATAEPTPLAATATPKPTPTPSPSPEPTPRTASLRFIGEISVDTNVLSAAVQPDGSYSFESMLSMAAGAVGNADYTIANVEGSMGGISEGYSGKKTYNTPEILIENLKDIGVDMLTLSNDHALDYGFDGLLSTITNCQDYGMDYVGGAATQEDHDTPKIVEINGINVAFLNYTTTLNSNEKKTSEDAVKYGVNLAKYSNSRTDAEAAREAGADVIIAIVSWSEDGATSIDKVQKQVAEILLDSGVDAIIGYGPRNTQAVLWLEVEGEADAPAEEPAEGDEAAATAAPAVKQRTICAISIGTFLSDSSTKGMDCGSIFEITLTEQPDGSFAIVSPTSIPTYVWKYNEDGKDFYRVLAVGEWLEEQPVGMSDESYARMQEIWQTMPETVTDASEVSAN